MNDSPTFLFSWSVLLLALTSVQLCMGQNEEPTLPSLPNYFSVYTETIQKINDSNSTVVLSRVSHTAYFAVVIIALAF